jgi:hypothetical protein
MLDLLLQFHADGLPSQIAERFMEAWGWLEREGFIAHRPNDINGHGFFVTRAGQRVGGDDPTLIDRIAS